MRVTWTVPLAMLLATAGCFDRAEAPEERPVALAVDGAPVTAAGIPLLPARFGLAETVDVTQWTNGTFGIDQHGRLGPVPPLPVAPAASAVRIDISSLVPRDVPVRIIGEVNAEVSRGDVDLWLEAPNDEWRTGNWNAPFGGFTHFEAGIVHTSAEPITVVLAYDEIDEQPEFAYALRVRVVAAPDLLINGIVTGVTLPAAAQMSVELVGEPREQELFDSVSLMVFSPTDEYLGAFPLGNGLTSIPLGDDAPAGEYAMMLSQGGRNARLLVAGENATLRPLGQEFVLSEPHAGDAPGHVAWSVEHRRTPLLVGVEFRAPNLASNVAVTITGPNGPVLEGTIESEVPWFGARAGDADFGEYFGWDSGYGAPGIAPGTYEGEIRFETAAGPDHVEAVDFAAFYVR